MLEIQNICFERDNKKILDNILPQITLKHQDSENKSEKSP